MAGKETPKSTSRCAHRGKLAILQDGPLPGRQQLIQPRPGVMVRIEVGASVETALVLTLTPFMGSVLSKVSPWTVSTFGGPVLVLFVMGVVRT